ncbi:MAG: hypothetical protein Q4G69_08415 [Planctomycetia bacterium]|nr:hypothetical protein [Planctomycetia bacterium]
MGEVPDELRRTEDPALLEVPARDEDPPVLEDPPDREADPVRAPPPDRTEDPVREDVPDLRADDDFPLLPAGRVDRAPDRPFRFPDPLCIAIAVPVDQILIFAESNFSILSLHSYYTIFFSFVENREDL